MLANPNAMFSQSPKWKGLVGSYRKYRGTGLNPKSFGDRDLKTGLSTSAFDVVGSICANDESDDTGVVMDVGWKKRSSG